MLKILTGKWEQPEISCWVYLMCLYDQHSHVNSWLYFPGKGDSAARPRCLFTSSSEEPTPRRKTQVQRFLQVLLARTTLATPLIEKINYSSPSHIHTYDDINTTVMSVKGTKAAMWACCLLRSSFDVTVMDSIGFSELDIAWGYSHANHKLKSLEGALVCYNKNILTSKKAADSSWSFDTCDCVEH